jgi:DNA-binding NarL/FixJ family response regulator
MADADLVIHCYGPYGLRQFILKRSSLFDIGHTQNEKRAAARYKPDLMIVDAGLGHGSGVAAVEQILRAGPIAHMFISGDAGGPRRVSRMQWWSANRFVRPSSSELSIARSLLAPAQFE